MSEERIYRVINPRRKDTQKENKRQIKINMDDMIKALDKR